MIKTFVVGDAEVVARINAKGDKLRTELRVGIGRLAIKLQRRVKQDKLSGQVLGVRTGRLRRSVEEVVIDEGDKVAGIVSTAVPYGIGWETGWQGGGVQGSIAASRSAAKAKFNVSGSMFQNGTPKERSFLRSALRDLSVSGDVEAELNASVGRALS